MANRQIKDLPSVSSVQEGDVFHINELASNADRKITFLNLEQLFINRNRANNTEAINGVDDNNFMTPLKSKAQLDSRLSTESESVNGSNNTKIMTPLRTLQSIQNQTPEIVKNENRDVLNNASPTLANRKYHITVTNTITLPVTSGLSVGDSVYFTKSLSVSPIVQVEGTNSENIVLGDGSTDNSVIFNINSEIIFIFNGINWEV